MSILEVVGSVGGFLLGICPIPETIKVVALGKSNHSWLFLAAWGIGDLCLLAYGIGAGLPLAIILNNLLNAVCIAVIVWYK